MNEKSRRGLILAGAAAAIGFLTGADGTRSVPVATRELVTLDHTVTLPGKVGVLEAAVSMSLSFEVSGRVARILGEGARVKEGEDIASLRSELEDVELRRAQILVRDAQAELERIRGLRRSKAASEKSLDAARVALALRTAERDAAQERLARRSLRADFDGIVADVRIDPGEVTVPGSPVASLLNFDLLKLDVGVPGYQLARIASGARVRVEVPALPGFETAGTLNRIAPSAPEGEHLFQSEVLVPNLDGMLKPGMSARAYIAAEQVDAAWVIPLECVVESRGQRMVFFVEEGVARAVSVEGAIPHGDLIVLPSADGDVMSSHQLVIRGQQDLRDGVAVRIEDAVLSPLSPLPVEGAVPSPLSPLPVEGAVLSPLPEVATP